MNRDDRIALVNRGRKVTLDGRDATVSGYNLPFARVASLDGKLSGEWAWETVARIIEQKDGRFLL